MAIIATTTSSSINVNARLGFDFILFTLFQHAGAVDDPLEIGSRLGRGNAADCSPHRWADRAVLAGDLPAMRRCVAVCVGEGGCAIVVRGRQVAPLGRLVAEYRPQKNQQVAVVDGLLSLVNEDELMGGVGDFPELFIPPKLGAHVGPGGPVEITVPDYISQGRTQRQRRVPEYIFVAD